MFDYLESNQDENGKEQRYIGRMCELRKSSLMQNVIISDIDWLKLL